MINPPLYQIDCQSHSSPSSTVAINLSGAAKQVIYAGREVQLTRLLNKNDQERVDAQTLQGNERNFVLVGDLQQIINCYRDN